MNTSPNFCTNCGAKIISGDKFCAGCGILSALTFGIVGIFYINPYFYTAFAGYYIELRDRALASGTIDINELVLGN